jgi:ribosomal protein S18 acetylase RimI-like enzyme
MLIKRINDISKLAEIRSLYIDAFSSGTSQQFIDNKELDRYIRTLLSTGYALLMLENEITIGVLLACPLTFDTLLPEEISRNYSPESSIYIAEMMVNENFRGQGIGKELLVEFLKTVDKTCYKDVFIRVWDKNIPALTLYEKTGFKRIAAVEQIKTKADGKEKFVMNKIYLYQKLN